MTSVAPQSPTSSPDGHRAPDAGSTWLFLTGSSPKVFGHLRKKILDGDMEWFMIPLDKGLEVGFKCR